MKYFDISEFECKCRCGSDDISQELLDKLEVARDKAGVAFVITSGVRCAAHNKRVGGVPSSSHIRGLAVDIKTPSGNARLNILRGLMAAGFSAHRYTSFIYSCRHKPNKATRFSLGLQIRV